MKKHFENKAFGRVLEPDPERNLIGGPEEVEVIEVDEPQPRVIEVVGEPAAAGQPPVIEIIGEPPDLIGAFRMEPRRRNAFETALQKQRRKVLKINKAGVSHYERKIAEEATFEAGPENQPPPPSGFFSDIWGMYAMPFRAAQNTIKSLTANPALRALGSAALSTVNNLAQASLLTINDVNRLSLAAAEAAINAGGASASLVNRAIAEGERVEAQEVAAVQGAASYTVALLEKAVAEGRRIGEINAQVGGAIISKVGAAAVEAYLDDVRAIGGGIAQELVQAVETVKEVAPKILSGEIVRIAWPKPPIPPKPPLSAFRPVLPPKPLRGPPVIPPKPPLSAFRPVLPPKPLRRKPRLPAKPKAKPKPKTKPSKGPKPPKPARDPVTGRFVARK